VRARVRVCACVPTDGRGDRSCRRCRLCNADSKSPTANYHAVPANTRYQQAGGICGSRDPALAALTPALRAAATPTTSTTAPRRLLHVLILTAGNVLDVVIYSDDGGGTWKMSSTPLPNNGEAQVAAITARVRPPCGSPAP